MAHRWWTDAHALRTLPAASIELDPFGFWHDQKSELTGQGGDKPSFAPGYAFHSVYVTSGDPMVLFTIRISGLRATRGHLAVNINVVDGRGISDSMRPKVKKISLARLARNGGTVSIGYRSRLSCSYAVVGLLSSNSDAQADSVAISVRGAETGVRLAEGLAAAQSEFLAEPGTGALTQLIVDRPATLETPISQMCTANQMSEPIYAEWCARMGSAPGRHRKQWEFVFILRTLEYYGALKEGARGLGFGVGVEPLTSIFAASGCEIVATDLAEGDERALIWNQTDQLGADLVQIYQPGLCDEAIFFERVTFRPVDMNAIPGDLRDFDFTWSSCAFEHLGSIKAGLKFFEESLACLKPGGIAVHTTELNLNSNDDTLDNSATVLFRRRDFEELARRLVARGHEVMPITFDSGDTDLDRVIDLPPYSHDPHLKLALLRWVSTSFGMIVRKGNA